MFASLWERVVYPVDFRSVGNQAVDSHHQVRAVKHTVVGRQKRAMNMKGVQ